MITSLAIENVRCLSDIQLELSPGFNLFVGKNGSGKTSVLEALHLSGLGKSFRHHLISPVIQYQKPHLSVSGVKQDSHGLLHHWGFLKNTDNKTHIRINQENIKSISQLTALLPLLAVHPQSDELISGSSKHRRQFMDWGLFHLDSRFYGLWKKQNSLLQQRNSLLKQRAPRRQLESWDRLFSACSEEIACQRQSYIYQLLPLFQDLLAAFTRVPDVSLIYRKGWKENLSLFEQLEKNTVRDTQTGYTSCGAHRDNLLVLSQGYSVSETFSRGEQKLVVLILKLAQALLLKTLSQKNCLFLLDDFAAELDPEHRCLTVESLAKMNSQVFMTSIEQSEVKEAFKNVENRMFHVEQGRINRV